MRDAESESHEGKRKVEAVWPIMRLSHARSRYIYDLYYKRELISRELYDWLLKQGYADANLIAKWKKNGYEKLCCVRCIQTRDMNFQGSTCICRVPKAQLKKGTVVECPHCGTSYAGALSSSHFTTRRYQVLHTKRTQVAKQTSQIYLHTPSVFKIYRYTAIWSTSQKLHGASLVPSADFLILELSPTPTRAGTVFRRAKLSPIVLNVTLRCDLANNVARADSKSPDRTS